MATVALDARIGRSLDCVARSRKAVSDSLLLLTRHADRFNRLSAELTDAQLLQAVDGRRAADQQQKIERETRQTIRDLLSP